MVLDFLRAFHTTGRQKNRRELPFYFLAAALFLLGVFFVPGFLLIGIIIAIVVLLAVRLDVALFLLAVSSFLVAWNINLSGSFLQNFFGAVWFSSTITLPIGDLIAMFVATAFVLRAIFTFRKKELFAGSLPGGLYYGLFLLAALISVHQANAYETLSSLKFWLRPMVFAYAMFVFLPNVLIREKEALLSVLRIWFGIGVGVAVYGLSSIFLGGVSGWTRVEPYPLWGITPLGTNHNLLAEPLVAILPVALYLFSRSGRYRQLVAAGAGLIALCALLTLSRAAWLSIALEMLILCYAYKTEVLRWIRDHAASSFFLFVVGIACGAYMAFFLSSAAIVADSDATRTTLTGIALTYAREAPLFGNGPGTFVTLLTDTQYYQMEFGDTPLDSHGFLQKVLVEEGIVGVIFFVAFLVWVFCALWQIERDRSKEENGLALYLLMMVAGIVMYELFNTSYFLSTMWMPIGVALAGRRLLSQK